MSEETAGSIQLNLEVTSDLNKSIQAQAQKIAERLKKQVEESGSGIFGGLQDGMDISLDKMTEAITKALSPIKMQMQSFLTTMESIVKRSSNIQMPTPQASDINIPQASNRMANATRAPPKKNIKLPTPKFDSQFNTEMEQQAIDELRHTINMYTSDLEVMQARRKELIRDSMEAEILNDKKAMEKLDIALRKVDLAIEATQDKMERSNITMRAYERKTIDASSGAKRLGNSAKELGNKTNILKSVFSSLNKTMKSIPFSSIEKGAKKLGNAFKFVGEPIKNFSKRLLGISTSTKKASNGMGRTGLSASRLAKSFLIYRIGFATLSKGINAMAKSLGETVMTNDQFASSLNQIKSNLDTAFTPIIQAILPSLNALMSTLATVTAYISAFTSAIFGKTLASSQKATQGIIDAKDAMGAYGNSTEKAAKKAKELQRSLLGFDEINKLNEKPDTSDDGSGSKKPVYTPTQIDPSGVSDFVKKMKEMFAKGDWDGIGKVIGQSINKGVTKFTEWISWSNVGGEVTNFVNALTGILNSTIAIIDWNAIGNMFGTGINTVANTIFLFFTGINWQNLGISIAKGLNGMVHTIDWKKIGKTFGSYSQSCINMMYGFVTTADWAGIGKGLGNSIMSMINYVDWNKFATALAKGISGAISSIHNFITTIDWSSLGLKIAGSINSFFANMNWADVGATLSDAAKGLLDTMINAFTNINWTQIGDSVANFLTSIDWIGVIGKLSIAIVSAILGINLAITEAIFKIAKALWDGLCNGIKEFFANPIEFIKTHIVDPIINGFKSLFGIHSPSTVMTDLGGFVMKGLVNGIKSIPIVGSIAGLVGDGLNWVKGKYNDFKTKGKELFDNVKNGIANNPITKTVGSAIGKGVDAVKNTFNDFKTKGSEIIGKLKGGIDLKSNTVSNAISNITSNISSSIRGVASNAWSWGSDMMSGLSRGISSASSWVSNAVSGIADTISRWLHFSRPDVGPLHYYEEWMPDMVRGLSKTLENSTPMFIDKVKSLAGSMTNAMQSSLNTPTIAFAGETELSVTHEWKESNKSKDLTMKDVIEEIKSLKQKFDEVKEEIRNKDMNAYIDGDDVTKKVVDNVNSDTRKNGKCPIDM